MCFTDVVFPYTNPSVVAHHLNIFLGSVYTATYRKVHALFDILGNVPRCVRHSYVNCSCTQLYATTTLSSLSTPLYPSVLVAYLRSSIMESLFIVDGSGIECG
jgi:hypothetical protein